VNYAQEAEPAAGTPSRRSLFAWLLAAALVALIANLLSDEKWRRIYADVTTTVQAGIANPPETRARPTR
jgi:hypothetical protein